MADITELNTQEEVGMILTEIYNITGYNFRDYSTAIIMRRLERRLISERFLNLSEILKKIHMNPDFAFELISDFSIHVTDMFRDPHVFKYIREFVIPELRKHDFIRIWVAGCSTGEEVYSLAIMLYEEGLYQRCRIYATDMNEDIILQAKSGSIPINKVEHYSNNYIFAGGKEQLSQYYFIKEGSLTLIPELLSNILFSHHNLVADRSFNEFHVIFCRNVLIYFNQWLRNHVHSLLFDSLAINGYLVLGGRESLRFTKHAKSYLNSSPLQKVFKRIN